MIEKKKTPESEAALRESFRAGLSALVAHVAPPAPKKPAPPAPKPVQPAPAVKMKTSPDQAVDNLANILFELVKALPEDEAQRFMEGLKKIDQEQGKKQRPKTSQNFNRAALGKHLMAALSGLNDDIYRYHNGLSGLSVSYYLRHSTIDAISRFSKRRIEIEFGETAREYLKLAPEMRNQFEHDLRQIKAALDDLDRATTPRPRY